MIYNYLITAHPDNTYLPPLDKIKDIRMALENEKLDSSIEYNDNGDDTDSPVALSPEQEMINRARDNFQPEDIIDRLVDSELSQIQQDFYSFLDTKLKLYEFFIICSKYDFDSRVAFRPADYTEKNKVRSSVTIRILSAPVWRANRGQVNM